MNFTPPIQKRCFSLEDEDYFKSNHKDADRVSYATDIFVLIFFTFCFVITGLYLLTIQYSTETIFYNGAEILFFFGSLGMIVSACIHIHKKRKIGKLRKEMVRCGYLA